MRRKLNLVLAIMVMAVAFVSPQTSAGATQAKAAVSLDDLFPDEILAKGKGFQVTRKEVDEAWVAFKANSAARGQVVREPQEAVEPQLVDRLIMVKLLLNRATDGDKTKGRERADTILQEIRARSNTPENLDRQLKSLGLTSQRFWEQLLERAICEEVMEREVKDGIKISAEEVKKFYDEHPERFTVPERIKLQHILFVLRDPQTGGPMKKDQIEVLRQQAEAVLVRARAGEDFPTLVQQYSQDPKLVETKGEIIIARGQTVPEFEGAAFSLPVGRISDVVMSGFGLHIIKLIEKLPPQKVDFDEMKERIEEGLVIREVEKLMPDFFEKMKKEAGVEYFGPIADAMKAGKNP